VLRSPGAPWLTHKWPWIEGCEKSGRAGSLHPRRCPRDHILATASRCSISFEARDTLCTLPFYVLLQCLPTSYLTYHSHRFELFANSQLHIDLDDSWDGISHYRVGFKPFESLVRDPTAEAAMRSWPKPLTIEFLEEQYARWREDLTAVCWDAREVSELGGGGATSAGAGTGGVSSGGVGQQGQPKLGREDEDELEEAI
jgi:hypothetical protein